MYQVVWCIEMNKNDKYKLAKRRLVYIKLKNKELLKKNAGENYNQSLLNACFEYLNSIEKPRFRVTAAQQTERNPENKAAM